MRVVKDIKLKMIKLSFAVALLLGANAVTTGSKANSDVSTQQIELRNIDYLGTIADIPPPTEDERQSVLAYWAGNDACIDLFTRIL